MKNRRDHPYADTTWKRVIDDGYNKKESTIRPETVNHILLHDIRAVLHDFLDEQRKTNKKLDDIFGGGDGAG